jgi:excisionase family DNA binding protein
VTVELLTARELAVILKVSVRTIRRWHELGEIPPGLRIGAQVRWRREEIEAFLLGPPKPSERGDRK